MRIATPLDRKAERSALALVRMGCCATLALFGALRLPGLADFSWTAAFLALQAAFAVGLSLTRLSTWIVALLGAPLPFLARLAAVAAMGTGDPTRDYAVLALDWSFVPFAALLAYAHAAAALAFRSPRAWVPAGLAAELGMLALLSWDLARSSGSVFAFPLQHALLVGGFVLLGAASLALRARLSRGAPLRSALAALLALPVAALVALLYLDAFQEASSAATGGLIKAESLRFDFDDRPKLQDSIDPGEPRLLFFVRKDGDARNYLVRRFILSGYREGEGFFPDPDDPYTAALPSAAPPSKASFPAPPAAARQKIEQGYYIVGVDPSSFFCLETPVAYAPLRQPVGGEFTAAFRVESMAPDQSMIRVLQQSRAPTAADMEGDSFALCTVPSRDPRIKILAEEVTGGEGGYNARVRAVLNYLRENYLYSRNPGFAPDGDRLGHFLFQSKKGYCTYFAYAMTLMLRSIGIPARVAAGVTLDEKEQPFGVYPVLSSMAHAWTEVFYPGVGWIDFDPTSRKPAPGEEGSLAAAPPASDYSKYLKSILESRAADDAGKEPPPKPGMWPPLELALRYWYAGIAAAYLLAVLIAEIARRIGPGLRRDARARYIAEYRLLERECGACGFRPARGETSMERGRRVLAEFGIDVGAAQMQADRAAYDPDWEPGDASKAALAEARRSIARARKLGKRIIARLDPRFSFGRRP